MTLADMEREMRDLFKSVDDTLAFLRQKVREHAEADMAYKRTYAESFLRAEGRIAEREQVAVLASVDLRGADHLASGLVQAALEAVRVRRTEISALQSLLAAHKAEAEFVRTGPQ